MDKTERTIAKVTNAGRILSRIAWIFDLIACGCSAFLILAALLWWNTRPDLFTGYASQTGALLICAGDLIGCAGSAVLAYFAGSILRMRWRRRRRLPCAGRRSRNGSAS